MREGPRSAKRPAGAPPDGGFALVVVMLLLVLLASMAAVLNQRAGMRSVIAGNHVRSIQRHFARSGVLQVARLRLAQDPAWRTASAGEDYTFDGATCHMTVTPGIHPTLGSVVNMVISVAGSRKPFRVVFVPETSVVIADTANNRVRLVDYMTGIITTLSSALNNPNDVVGDSRGRVIISDTSANMIRRLDLSTGIMTTIAGTGAGIYFGNGIPAVLASLKGPEGVALDAQENIYIADTQNDRIRKIDAATGIITTIAGTAFQGYTGDGDFATNARLNSPAGVVCDPQGNVFIADTKNNAVRRIDAATGKIATVAGTGELGYSGDDGPAVSAKLKACEGVAVNFAGDLFICDTGNNVIRRVDAATGIITTYAGTGSALLPGDGGLAVNANLKLPQGIAIDPAGNVYVADSGFNRLRRIDFATTVITTLAGTGTGGYAGDGGPATGALLKQPSGVHFTVNTMSPVRGAY